MTLGPGLARNITAAVGADVGPVSQNIHGFDEKVSLFSLRNVTKTVALFIADWCGLNRI